MGQFNDISTIRSRPRLNPFLRECAIFILSASQVERLSVSKILFCICPVLSPSVENVENEQARKPAICDMFVCKH